jgi:hypothetical protein
MSKVMDIKYGISATFNSAKDIFDAAGKVRDQGYTNWECYTPMPIHGLDGQMGYGRSKVPCFTLAGGITGFFTGMLIVWFMNAYDYPLIVGGKPYFSPIYPFPVFYELTILFAAFGTLFGMFFLNRLPRHNHPVFEHKGFGRTGDDKFMIVIEVEDPQFDEVETQSFLKELGGKSVSVIREPIE